jgi:hypothetical protein
VARPHVVSGKTRPSVRPTRSERRGRQVLRPAMSPYAMHFIGGSATQARREHDSHRRPSIRVVRVKGRQSRALARSRSMSVVPCVTSVVGMNAFCGSLCQRSYPSSATLPASGDYALPPSLYATPARFKAGFPSGRHARRSKSTTAVECSRTCPRAGDRRRNWFNLFSGRLKRRCNGGDTVTETALQP